MTIIISLPVSGPLASYPDLVTAIEEWLDRNDLTARIPSFISLAEADFRRQIVMPDMETVVIVVTSATVPLPFDMDSIREVLALETTTCPQHTVTPVTPATLDDMRTDAVGHPRYYAVDAGTISFWPMPTEPTSFKLSYRAKLPSLAELGATNWLLDQHPDVYLFGSLLQAEFFGWNDDRLPLIQAKLASIIDDINMAGNRKRYGGQLTMRPSFSEGLGYRGLLR